MTAVFMLLQDDTPIQYFRKAEDADRYLQSILLRDKAMGAEHDYQIIKTEDRT